MAFSLILPAYPCVWVNVRWSMEEEEGVVERGSSVFTTVPASVLCLPHGACLLTRLGLFGLWSLIHLRVQRPQEALWSQRSELRTAEVFVLTASGQSVWQTHRERALSHGKNQMMLTSFWKCFPLHELL